LNEPLGDLSEAWRGLVLEASTSVCGIARRDRLPKLRSSSGTSAVAGLDDLSVDFSSETYRWLCEQYVPVPVLVPLLVSGMRLQEEE